jgi:redox-regulated HSP33 family molecular chaperone
MENIIQMDLEDKLTISKTLINEQLGGILTIKQLVSALKKEDITLNGIVKGNGKIKAIVTIWDTRQMLMF